MTEHKNRAITPENDDKAFDLALRPVSFDEYIGQDNIKKNFF
jgi:Holliday junction resolvasome RuvABC ATP-dependent DNA helicase subunit